MAATRIFSDEPPDLSNYCYLPDKARGFPLLVKHCSINSRLKPALNAGHMVL